MIAAVAVLLFSGAERIEMAAMQITELVVTAPAIKGSVAISTFIRIPSSLAGDVSSIFWAHWLSQFL